MARRRRSLFLLLLGLLVALLLLGALNGVRVKSSFGGREIVGVSRHLLSGASLSGGLTSTTLTLGSRTATVTADTVTLDDGRVVAIPASCQQVEVRETRAGLVVSLDGVRAP